MNTKRIAATIAATLALSTGGVAFGAGPAGAEQAQATRETCDAVKAELQNLLELDLIITDRYLLRYQTRRSAYLKSFYRDHCKNGGWVIPN